MTGAPGASPRASKRLFAISASTSASSRSSLSWSRNVGPVVTTDVRTAGIPWARPAGSTARSCGRTNSHAGPSAMAMPNGGSNRPPATSTRPARTLAGQAVGAAEELVDEGRGRPVVDLPRAADLLDLALAHEDHLVGELERFFLVVGDEDAGEAETPVQITQPAAQVLPDLGIERAERLVEQEDARLDRQRPGERHPLPLAARKLVRIAAREALELYQPQQLHHPLANLRLGRPGPARPHAQAEGDVLEHAHVPEQRVVLEDEPDLALARIAPDHVLAREADLAAIRELEPGDDPEQRRLARAGRAQKRAELAFADVQAHLVERRVSVEGLGQVTDLDTHGGSPRLALERDVARASIATPGRPSARASAEPAG